MLRCLGEDETHLVLLEVHKGVWGSHIDGLALATKLLRVGCYLPTLLNDCTEFVLRCDKFQWFSDLNHAPATKLTSVYSAWPFHKWGVDIVWLFPLASRQLKFLIVGVDHFTKWIKAEAVEKLWWSRSSVFIGKNSYAGLDFPKS
jgi:hypothetical protein